MLNIIRLNFKISLTPSKIGVNKPKRNKPGPIRFWKVAIIFLSNNDINPEKIIIKIKNISSVINISNINIIKRFWGSVWWCRGVGLVEVFRVLGGFFGEERGGGRFKIIQK